MVEVKDAVEQPDVRRPALIGLVAVVLLLTAAIVVPELADWPVHENSHDDGVAPLNGYLDVKVGIGTPLAVLVAVVTIAWFPRLADRIAWRRLLATSAVMALGWLLSLALVDGSSGLSRTLGNKDEYLRTAREVTSIGDLLSTYTDHITFEADHTWPVHVAGHPPGMLLFFVGLVRLGLGGDLAAGLVVTLIACTIPAAVLVTVRALGDEALGRSAAPYLVLTPTAVFLAVSADAVIAATVAWGLAALAIGARRSIRAGWPWAVLAGLLLGYAVLMSYGMPLAGLLALAVLLVARSWWPLPVAAAAAAVVALAFAAGGFVWWEALPDLRHRYEQGIALDRPASYWLWANLGALAISTGPLLGASLGAAWARRRVARVGAILVAAGVACVAAADLSLMSKAEVERIWLPFMPWLMLGAAFLPTRWRPWALGLQAAAALVVQHMVHTNW